MKSDNCKIKTKNAKNSAAIEPCIHKSHCKLEALKTLNLAHNSLTSIELLALSNTKIIDFEQFDWKENGQQVKFFLFNFLHGFFFINFLILKNFLIKP